MTKEEFLDTMFRLSDSVLRHLIAECEKIGATPHSLVAVPLMIAEALLSDVAEDEKRRGIESTGLAHAMLKHLTPIGVAAHSVAEQRLRMEPSTEEEFQAIIKQIEGMEEPTE